MPKLRFTKKKEFKHQNAKGELEEQLKADLLKKYGKTLGADHPFNKMKEKKEIKDFEKIFNKGGAKRDKKDKGLKKGK
tara:strand:+ start:1007 stop:1240 length:234 start_codon:yes stop_codon:yes gene_type:complete